MELKQRTTRNPLRRYWWGVSDRWQQHKARERWIGATVVVDGVERTVTSVSQSVVRVERRK